MISLSTNFGRVVQTAKSAVVVLCGLAALARSQLAGQGAVLVFHGLRADGKPGGVMDEGLHLPVSVFRSLCQHLAANYHVMPLSAMAAMLRNDEPLPARAVAITFDDGYASNGELGFPVLKELGLPATIFLATGFLDGTAPLWFQQVDLAMGAGAVSSEGSLGETLTALKRLPNEAMRERVSDLVKGAARDLPQPEVTRALTWDQIRSMRDSGLIEFGGHTHTHPILARCSLEQQRWEIETCRDRIRAELGEAPRLFAFPNGGEGDYTAETLHLLTQAGFESAWTMISGRASLEGFMMQMPRYGSPESIWEAEATVSGAFELLKRWKGGMV